MNSLIKYQLEQAIAVHILRSKCDRKHFKHSPLPPSNLNKCSDPNRS
ncbi:hypothetical protein [Microcoleus sp. D3_18_C4]